MCSSDFVFLYFVIDFVRETRISIFNMQQIYFYSIIFVMGVMCSITIMLILTHFSPNPRNKLPNYLSDVHYLQVRDDYSLYSLSSDGAAAYDHHHENKKRNSVEGKPFSIKMPARVLSSMFHFRWKWSAQYIKSCIRTKSTRKIG